MGNIGSYAYLNAKIRARLSSLLDEQAISSLVRTDSTETFLLQLQTFSPYAFVKTVDISDLGPGENNRKLENALLDHFQDSMLGLVRATGDILLRKLLSSLLKAYEIDNLKKVLSHVFLGKPINLVYSVQIGKFDPQTLVRSASPDELMLKLRETEYYKILLKSYGQFSTNKTLFFMFLDLDRHFFNQLYESVFKADVSDRTAVRNYFNLLVDFSNLQTHLRLRHFYKVPQFDLLTYLAPYGKIYEIFKRSSNTELVDLLPAVGKPGSEHFVRITQELDVGVQTILIEKMMDEVLLLESRRLLAQDPFSVAVFMAYYILKSRELSKVFAIMNGKFYGLPEDRIREAL